MRRSVLLLLCALLTIPVMGKRDSLLWVGIQQTGTLYRQGLRDSARQEARRLLTVAEGQGDALAQACLLQTDAFCLTDAGRGEEGAQRLERLVDIGETDGFLRKAAKARHNLYFTTMMTSYGLLTQYHHSRRHRQKALRYGRSGMEWIALCRDDRLRVSTLCTLADALMDGHEYQLLYEPMKEAVPEALRQGLADHALQLMAYLTRIEREAMHRRMADIPWVKAGRELLPEAKTEAAKTLFLSVVELTPPQEDTPAAPPTASPSTPDSRPTAAVTPPTAAPDSVQTRIRYIERRRERLGLASLLLVLVAAAFVAYALWQRRLRRRSSQEAERQRAESYLEGQEQERSRLAKELHDGVSNQLLAIQMKLDADGPTEQTLQLLSESREQVRRVSHELMPPEFSHATLDEVTAHYLEEVNEGSPCDVTCSVNTPDADWASIPPQQALEIYRIIQEAVTNALKHADATTVAVGLWHTGRQTRVVVSDNGTADFPAASDPAGADSTAANNTAALKGIGLRTMRQRADAIGATLEISRNRYGHVVQLTVE